MKKQNPTTENIMISEEKLVEYNSKLKGNPKSPIQLSREGKFKLAKEYLGGICSICAEIATKKVKYDEGDGIIIEKYCDRCLERYLTKEQEQEPSTYTKEDKVHLTATNGVDQTLAIKMQEWKRSNKYHE